MINLRKAKTIADKLVEQFKTNTKEDKIVLSLLLIGVVSSILEVIVLVICI